MREENNIDEKGTFAYLRSDGLPEACNWSQWKNWFESGGERLCRIKYDRVDECGIETRFDGFSAELDGPLLFWEVSANHRRLSPYVERFGTKEAALQTHEALLTRALANELPR
jgi:hypothetical protein